MIRCIQILSVLATLTFSNLLSFNPIILPSAPDTADSSITHIRLRSVPIILTTQTLNIDPHTIATTTNREIKTKMKQ